MSLSHLLSAPAFGSDARLGRWQDREVLVYFGPQVEGAVESSRARAEPWIGQELQGAWPLLGVEDHEDRPAWIYPYHDGISGLALLVRPPPMRACLNLAGRILEILRAQESEGVVHPGPMAADVLLDGSGDVHLAGYVGPAHAHPTRQPPGTSSGAQHLAYRVGALTCELLGATVPTPADTDEGQRTLQRRVAIRIMSRPGPLIDETLRNELVRCLAFEPEVRPSLDQLRGVIEQAASLLLQQPDLPAWAPNGVPTCRQLSSANHRSTAEFSTADLLTDSHHADGGFVDDDVTAVSAGSTPGTYRRVELGSIPVTVGPPPEVARLRPTLPPDLFDEDPTPISDDAEPGYDPEPPPGGRRSAVLAAVAGVLLLVAVALAFYVF